MRIRVSEPFLATKSNVNDARTSSRGGARTRTGGVLEAARILTTYLRLCVQLKAGAIETLSDSRRNLRAPIYGRVHQDNFNDLVCTILTVRVAYPAARKRAA
jgi:hypothetical protein